MLRERQEVDIPMQRKLLAFTYHCFCRFDECTPVLLSSSGGINNTRRSFHIWRRYFLSLTTLPFLDYARDFTYRHALYRHHLLLTFTA